ncbi:hypothetical protein EVAR_54243_1 [Eumeta japonica]|uniref:Uncharacterized protein n=1 Tax=Eumeta variegata TaxID=151549 RepID=A0A4C1YEV3_EUMVA|nr:hypothetical protein EVAR_54243_1 [Eumeta japonica]
MSLSSICICALSNFTSAVPKFPIRTAADGGCGSITFGRRSHRNCRRGALSFNLVTLKFVKMAAVVPKSRAGVAAGADAAEAGQSAAADGTRLGRP